MGKNIFERSHVAVGEAFLGRGGQVNALLEELRRDREVHLSCNGMHRVGKSSIRQCAESILRKEMPANRIMVSLALDTYENVFSFWYDVVLHIEEELLGRGLMTPRLEPVIASCLSVIGSGNVIGLCPRVTRLFRELKLAGVRTLLIIDEFDKATERFKGYNAQFEMLRNLNTESGQYALSTVLIHRHQLTTISQSVHNSSTFYGAFTTKVIPVFDDEDMAAYYQVFAREFGYEFTQQKKADVEYYAGRIPYLLSNLGYAICEQLRAGAAEIDVNAIYRQPEVHEAFVQYYRDMIELLRGDGLLADAIGTVIGPQIGVPQDAVITLKNLSYIRESGDYYISICEKFSEILYLQEVENATWNYLRQVESELKRLVEARLPVFVHPAGGQTYMDALWEVTMYSDLTRTRTYYFREDKYQRYISTGREYFGYPYTLLDVMTFGDLRILLFSFWDVFADAFGRSAGTWYNKFLLCEKARDMRAHNNENTMRPSDVNLVNQYCQEILDCLHRVSPVDPAN